MAGRNLDATFDVHWQTRLCRSKARKEDFGHVPSELRIRHGGLMPGRNAVDQVLVNIAGGERCDIDS